MEDRQVGEYFISESQIGSGSFSKVYLAKDRAGRKAAVKIIKKTSKTSEHIKLAQRQARILYNLQCPSICTFLGSFQSQSTFYLFENYYQGENLHKLLRRAKRLPSNEAEDIFCLLLTAFEYLHKKGVMHRDVKPENIIYHNQKVVLLDFGFACLIPEGDPMSMTECVGSPVYMSPELLLRRKYNSKSDIWSLGVLLYEMVYGIVPFYSTSESKLLESILTKSVRYNPYIEVKDSLKELISKCLVVDVNARINWKELFRWSKKNNRKIREWFEEDTDSVCYCRWF